MPKRRQDGHTGLETGPETVPSCPVHAIARVRLAPAASRQIFEKQLQAIPAVRSAWHVTGDVDYEMRLTCRDLAALGTVLRDLRHCCGAEVASAGLVLGEVTGLAGLDLPDRSSP